MPSLLLYLRLTLNTVGKSTNPLFAQFFPGIKGSIHSKIYSVWFQVHENSNPTGIYLLKLIIKTWKQYVKFVQS